MSGNAIPSIPQLVLPKLKLLDLSKNRIRILDETTFDKTPALEKLFLGGNQIKLIPVLKLPNVTNLDLTNNFIDAINIDTFSGMPKLKYLWLNGNDKITSIPENAFKNTELSTIYASANLVISAKNLEFRSILGKTIQIRTP